LEELRQKLERTGPLQHRQDTLTRRAAEAQRALALALLEGPTAIAFVEADGDPVAVESCGTQRHEIMCSAGRMEGSPITGET